MVTRRIPNSQVIQSEAAGMDKAPCQTDITCARNMLQCGGHAALAISCITCACVTGRGVSSHTYEVSTLQLSLETCWQRGELGCFPHAPHLLAASDRGMVPGEARPLWQHQVHFLPWRSSPGDPWLVIHP